jgi:predicted component of type VI protein secretion system
MTWWLEAVSLALAIAALSAIVGIMAEYHDKQQPEWKYRINLNTVIAILSTLMRACVVVVAEEGET